MSLPHRLAAVAALMLLTIAAYSNSFSAGFPFDNKQLILQDPRVHEASAANVDLILHHSYWWPYGESGLYRPVTTLSYLFNYAVAGNGDRPAGYHAVNLALHLVNVLLAFALMMRLTSPVEAGHYRGSAEAGRPRGPVEAGHHRTSAPTSTPAATPAAPASTPAASAASVVSGFSRTVVPLATAAVWAVHPLSTEAVTNIVGRADLLAATAVLGALLMYLRGREASGWRRTAWLAGVAAAAAIGCFSKESAVVIAPAIALYEIVWWNPKKSRAALVAAAVALAPPLIWMWAQRSAVLGSSPTAEFAFVDNPIVGAGFWAGRLTAVKVMAKYAALLAWPATLSSDYSYPQITLVRGSAGDWIACIAVAGLALLATWRVLEDPPGTRAWAAPLFFAAFAFVTFLPASNLLFPTGTIMAERLMYLPSLGLVALGVAGLFAAADALHARTAAIVVVSVMIAACGYRTWTRNPDWQTDVTLWTSAVRASPDSAKAHRALAEALYDADPAHAGIDRIIVEAERSVALLESVPDRRNSYQPFRQAGAYHLDRADELRRRASAGDASAGAEAERGYRRSLTLLQRALAIVRAGSAQIAGASVAPEADVNRLLAAAHLGLDDPSSALEAAARARALDPLSPLAYRLAADAQLGLHRADAAAVTLMVGSIVTDDAGLAQALMGLYRSGLDESGCAIVATAGGPALNPSCPLVRQHLCRASAEAVEVNERLGRHDRAERARAFAAGQAGCR